LNDKLKRSAIKLFWSTLIPYARRGSKVLCYIDSEIAVR